MKTTTRMLWLLWKLYHNWVASRKTRKHWFLKEENSTGETRRKKSWDRFEEYDSLSLHYVKQVSGKRKDHRLEKYKSKILISEVPTLWHLRTGPMKRLKDNSDAPEVADQHTSHLTHNLAESGHPIFRATSALERGELWSKTKGRKSNHFNGGEENIKLILRTGSSRSVTHLNSDNVVSVGNTAQQCRLGFVSRLWFCRRPWRLKINIRWTLVHFRKSNIRTNKLDVQETDISLT